MITPDPALFRHLFEFMKWADIELMDAARAVGDHAYYADRGFSLGSIHKLLVHAMGGQKLWLGRWDGTGLDRTLTETHAEYPSRESLEAGWPRVHAGLFAFLDTQTPETLSRPIAWTNSLGEHYSRPLGHLIYHVIDHSAYHRGQLNSMIKLAGGETARPYYSRYPPGDAQ